MHVGDTLEGMEFYGGHFAEMSRFDIGKLTDFTLALLEVEINR
jgi:hypothetical protein